MTCSDSSTDHLKLGKMPGLCREVSQSPGGWGACAGQGGGRPRTLQGPWEDGPFLQGPATAEPQHRPPYIPTPRPFSFCQIMSVRSTKRRRHRPAGKTKM